MRVHRARALRRALAGLACGLHASAAHVVCAADTGAGMESWSPARWYPAAQEGTGTKLDLGLVILPSALEVPVFLTNPRDARAGAPRTTSVASGLDWRLGVWLGPVSIEVHAGQWWLGDNGIRRAYVHPLVRYVLTNRSWVYPFAGVGAGLSWWSTAEQVGPDGNLRPLDAALVKGGTATIGTYVNVYRSAKAGGCYLLELGTRGAIDLRGDAFAQNQLAIVPYVGLIGLLPL